MKRWWWILAAIIAFFVGDRIGSLLLGRLLDRSPQRFCQLYAGKLAAEIVLLGNSRGANDFHAPSIAEATGKTVVNISHNGMTPQIARAIFEDYLAMNPPPRLLVIEVSFVTVTTTEAGVVEYMPFWSHSQRLLSLGDEYAHDEVVAGDISRLYRFNSELFLRSLIYLARGASDQGMGMAMNVSQQLLEEVAKLPPQRLEINATELEALAGIVKTAQAAGIEVRLVLAPYLPAYADKLTNLATAISEIEAKTGSKVLDLTRAFTDTDLFADRVHINIQGRQALTAKLLEAGVFELPRTSLQPTSKTTVGRPSRLQVAAVPRATSVP